MGSLNTLQGASRVVILCRAGSRLCALPIEHVTLTLRPVPVEAVAGAPPFVRGLAVIRGAPVPVVDAARLIGVESAPAGTDRFVIVRLGNRSAALAVDAVLGVERLTSEIVSELPPLLGAAGGEIVSQMATLDSALLFVLESAQLLPETFWATLAAKGASA